MKFHKTIIQVVPCLMLNSLAWGATATQTTQPSPSTPDNAQPGIPSEHDRTAVDRGATGYSYNTKDAGTAPAGTATSATGDTTNDAAANAAASRASTPATDPANTTTTPILPTPSTGTGAVTDSVVMTQQQADMVSVDFTKDSAELKQQDKDAISQAIAGKTDMAKEIRVAVWSDKPWPAATSDNKFSRDEQKLADKRADTLKSYLKEVAPKVDVTVYKMVDDGRQLAKDLGTDRDELKSVFAKKGDTGKAPAEALSLSAHGGAGRAVIFMKMKDDKK